MSVKTQVFETSASTNSAIRANVFGQDKPAIMFAADGRAFLRQVRHPGILEVDCEITAFKRILLLYRKVRKLHIEVFYRSVAFSSPCHPKL